MVKNRDSRRSCKRSCKILRSRQSVHERYKFHEQVEKRLAGDIDRNLKKFETAVPRSAAVPAMFRKLARARGFGFERVFSRGRSFPSGEGRAFTWKTTITAGRPSLSLSNGRVETQEATSRLSFHPRIRLGGNSHFETRFSDNPNFLKAPLYIFRRVTFAILRLPPSLSLSLHHF